MGPEPALKGKLLIVDDETPIRGALRKTLQAMGFEAAEVDSEEGAIALVRTVGFDTVLLDISMPGKSRIETCRELRKLMPFAEV